MSAANSIMNTLAADSGLVDSILAGIPSFDELIDQKDLADDHRETVKYQGNQETVFSLEATSATQLILRQTASENDDAYTFEYDPSIFEVTPSSADGTLSITVSMLKDKPTNGDQNYKCYLNLPAREFKEIKLDLTHSGVALDRVTSPITAKDQGSGISLSNCTGDITIEDMEGALAADVPSGYQGKFTYNNESGAFMLRFLDGEPENFRFQLESANSVVTHPSNWGTGLLDSSFDYEKGNGGATFDFSISNGAGAIT